MLIYIRISHNKTPTFEWLEGTCKRIKTVSTQVEAFKNNNKALSKLGEEKIFKNQVNKKSGT